MNFQGNEEILTALINSRDWMKIAVSKLREKERWDLLPAYERHLADLSDKVKILTILLKEEKEYANRPAGD